MQQITLDARLSRVADMVPECGVCADIGADHGFLSAWLLSSGRVGRMYICDISAPSLDKARRLFDGDALAERARFEVGDGLERVSEPLDACVVAGMGGETMMGILERGLGVIRGATLVLQPNVDADRVRVWLYDHGFAVTDEELIYDGRWWYSIMQAKPDAGAARPDERELLVGPVLLRRRHELLPRFAQRQVRILKNAIAPIALDNPRAAELSRRLDIWKEIAQWQK